MHSNKSFASSLLLLLTALIWGFAFVAQSEGANYVGSFTFIASRYLLGGLVLIPVIAINRKRERLTVTEKNELNKNSIKGGIYIGIALFVSSSLQQFGIPLTSVGKAGFITALYMIFVPITGIFFKKKLKAVIWLSVILATLGMYLLCINETLRLEKGDLLVFLCAIGYTGHILLIDKYSPKADGVLMSCVQFFIAGLLGCIFALIFETVSMSSIIAGGIPILYAGILSSGVGYTLQIVAQKNIEPSIASLIMSLESVFSLLAGWVILHQVLSVKELCGCILVFAAVLLTMTPDLKKK